MTRRELIEALRSEANWVHSNAGKFFAGLSLDKVQGQAVRLAEAYISLDKALDVLEGFVSAGAPEVGA